MIAINITTINMPTMLEKLIQNLTYYEHLEDTLIVVTGDHKTPATCCVYLKELQHKTGAEIVWMGVAQQKDFIGDNDLGELHDYIGWNTLGRRNFGTLFALLEGAEVIVQLDDDNVPLEHYDFYHRHDLTQFDIFPFQRKHFTGKIRWANPLALCYRQAKHRHRGFPHGAVFSHGDLLEAPVAPIWVNEGLWIGELDVDAHFRIEDSCLHWDMPIRELTLMPGWWAPMNSQNTSFHRALGPAMFLDSRLGRYDDIWCSYICRKVMDLKGVSAKFGHPVCSHYQDRSIGSVVDDLRMELDGLKHTPRFIRWLEGWCYQKEDATVREIVERMAGDLDGACYFPPGLKTWIATLDKLSLDFPA